VAHLNAAARVALAGQPAEALRLAQAAETQALADGDQPGLATALLLQGRAHMAAQAPLAQTLPPLERAALLYQGLGDLAGEARTVNLQALAHAGGDDLEAALRCHHRGITLRQRLGDKAGEAGLLANIGALLREHGQYAEALKYLLMAQEVAQQAGDARAVAHALAHTGTVLDALDDTPRALEHLLRAQRLAEGVADPALAAAVHTSLGRLLARSGQPAEGQRHLTRALTQARASAQPAVTAQALLGLGLVQQQAGALPGAERVLLEALTLAQRAGRRAAQAEALLALARNHWLQDQGETALRLLDDALALLQPLPPDHLAGRLHELLSAIHEQRGAHAEALYHYKAFHAGQQRLRGQDTQRRARALLARTELDAAQRSAHALADELDAARASGREQQALLDQLAAQSELLRQLAREDGLTGLANRRWLDTQLAHEAERARRYRHPLSVAMIDVDHFKRINDRCSHRVGDEVLRRLAGLLRGACRQVDVVGRYGGEEFVLLLPETPLMAASAVCEKLRQRIAALHVGDLHPDLVQVTASIGLAGAEGAAVQAEALVQAADAQLYRAKAEGRNRVCVDRASG